MAQFSKTESRREARLHLARSTAALASFKYAQYDAPALGGVVDGAAGVSAAKPLPGVD